ncbi:MAG: hypothetical protein UY04_C0011G0022 [Parcubacteria group bacterium GW2011_GWA2_47_7]|nr:MAG: hypothetical protein UY04_C0011G0022 [Parcubacteria group bacterium GW2011_GWA2_47_7]
MDKLAAFMLEAFTRNIFLSCKTCDARALASQTLVFILDRPLEFILTLFTHVETLLLDTPNS